MRKKWEVVAGGQKDTRHLLGIGTNFQSRIVLTMADPADAPLAPAAPPFPVPLQGNVTSPPSSTTNAAAPSENGVTVEQQTTTATANFLTPVHTMPHDPGAVSVHGAPSSGGSKSSSRPPQTTSRKKNKKRVAGRVRMGINKRCNK